MDKLCPNLMVEDVKKTVEFYSKNFGFKVSIAVPDESNPIFASLTNGNVEIMFQQRDSLEGEYPMLKGKELGGTFTLFINANNVKGIYDTCKANNIEIVKDIHKTFYGGDEFGTVDNNGYVLCFAENQ